MLFAGRWAFNPRILTEVIIWFQSNETLSRRHWIRHSPVEKKVAGGNYRDCNRARGLVRLSNSEDNIVLTENLPLTIRCTLAS